VSALLLRAPPLLLEVVGGTFKSPYLLS